MDTLNDIGYINLRETGVYQNQEIWNRKIIGNFLEHEVIKIFPDGQIISVF